MILYTLQTWTNFIEKIVYNYNTKYTLSTILLKKRKILISPFFPPLLRSTFHVYDNLCRVSVLGDAARSPSPGLPCCRRDQICNQHDVLSLPPLEGLPPASAASLAAPVSVTPQCLRRLRHLRLRPLRSLRPPSPPARRIRPFKDALPRASSPARPQCRQVNPRRQPSPSSLPMALPAGRRHLPASSARRQAPNCPVDLLCSPAWRTQQDISPRRLSQAWALRTSLLRCRRQLLGRRQRCPAKTATAHLLPC